MSSKAANLIKTIAWCAMVVLAVYYLICAVSTGNLVATAIAAALTFLVVKTSAMVPIPEIYRKQGATEEMFSSRRKKKSAQQ